MLAHRAGGHAEPPGQLAGRAGGFQTGQDGGPAAPDERAQGVWGRCGDGLPLAPERFRGRYSGLWGVSWSGGFLLAPLGGTWLLGIAAPALWLTCAAVCGCAAAAQLALGPAIRRRTLVT